MTIRVNKVEPKAWLSPPLTMVKVLDYFPCPYLYGYLYMHFDNGKISKIDDVLNEPPCLNIKSSFGTNWVFELIGTWTTETVDNGLRILK